MDKIFILVTGEKLSSVGFIPPLSMKNQPIGQEEEEEAEEMKKKKEKGGGADIGRRRESLSRR